MRLISSRTTVYLKRALPLGIAAFFVLAIAAALGAQGRTGQRAPPALILGFAAIWATAVFYGWRKLFFNLADRVFDCGDSLLVVYGRNEHRISLGNVVNVGWSPLSRGRVQLLLRDPAPFGREVSFLLPTNFGFASTHPVIEDLIARVDAARRTPVP